jgi:hypothetical protein
MVSSSSATNQGVVVPPFGGLENLPTAISRSDIQPEHVDSAGQSGSSNMESNAEDGDPVAELAGPKRDHRFAAPTERTPSRDSTGNGVRLWQR